MPKERLLQCQAEDQAKGLSEHHLQQCRCWVSPRGYTHVQG
jgi:hypothetical protein